MTPQALTQVEQFFRYLETERRYSRNTLAAYRRDLVALSAFCDAQGITKWKDLQSGHVRTFAAESHKGGLSPASVQRRLSAVRTFMKFLIRERLLSGNPAEGIQAPKHHRRLPQGLSADEAAQLLDKISGQDPLSIRDRAMCELLYSSGLRLSELVGLDVSNLDLYDRTVQVLGKGRKERIVPVGRVAIEALRAWLKRRASLIPPRRSHESALFVGQNGRRLGQRAVQLRVAFWSKDGQARESTFVPACLRYAFA